MAGSKHQFILGLVVKKMRKNGFKIEGIDGDYPGLFGKKIPIPPQILRHRPDAIGVNRGGQISIGEAKTENDITNKRTYSQLEDFTKIVLNGKKCHVYVGIPKSSKELFDKKLHKLGLRSAKNIEVLYVPDEIIND